MTDISVRPALTKPCLATMHGLFTRISVWEFDPDCQTCKVRDMLAEHDHLHLHGEECTEPGLNGEPGQNVRCRCGGYHH